MSGTGHALQMPINLARVVKGKTLFDPDQPPPSLFHA